MLSCYQAALLLPFQKHLALAARSGLAALFCPIYLPKFLVRTELTLVLTELPSPVLSAYPMRVLNFGHAATELRAEWYEHSCPLLSWLPTQGLTEEQRVQLERSFSCACACVAIDLVLSLFLLSLLLLSLLLLSCGPRLGELLKQLLAGGRRRGRGRRGGGR
eukprot:3796284-Rhodomonas_salina.1